MPTCNTYYKNGDDYFQIKPNGTVIHIELIGENDHCVHVNPESPSAEQIEGYTAITEADYVAIVIGNTAVSLVGSRPDIDP